MPRSDRQFDDSWRDAAKKLHVLQVAQALGITVSRNRFGPCPACHETSRKDETRLAAGVYNGGTRWICNACHVKGDVIDLVSWAIVGRAGNDAGRDFPKVREWFAGSGEQARHVKVKAHEMRRAPSAEIARVMTAATPLHRSRSPRIRAWARRRSLEGVVPAFVAPGASWAGWGRLTDRWWSRAWAEPWPVIAPAYTGAGELAGMHARAIAPETSPKTRWPYRCSSRGLVFADPWLALPALRGAWDGVRALVFVEGFTDYLTAARDAHRDGGGVAVLGVESGSDSRVTQLRGLPAAVEVFVGTHDDGKGDLYAATIINQMALAHGRADVYRIPLWKLGRQQESA